MKFIYIDSDKGNKKKIEVSDTDISAVKVNQTELKLLTNNTLQAEPGYFHHTWQSCDWRIVDENGKLVSGLFHERMYTPWNFYKEIKVVYWLCDCDFKSPEEACLEIVKRGCDPNKFWAQQHFYTSIDGEGCFIITSDFDEALKFYGYKYEGDKDLQKDKNIKESK